MFELWSCIADIEDRPVPPPRERSANRQELRGDRSLVEAAVKLDGGDALQYAVEDGRTPRTSNFLSSCVGLVRGRMRCRLRGADCMDFVF